jgi:molybdate transport system substrate-binding protein
VRRLLLLAVASLLLPGGAVARPDADGLNVYAAASLTDVFRRIDPQPAYNFAGSNQLAFQLRRGAAADVFASASPKYTQSLFRDGLVERPRTFASNALVLAVPRSNPAGLRSVYDLRRKGVRLVVAGPDVPIGAYTREMLRRLGLTSVLDRVVSQELDVKGLVGKLALAQADAGFVYRTDVKAASGRVTAISLPARAQPTVRYEIAVVRGSAQLTAARAWVRAIATSARARRLLARAGFVTE